jgi:RNA polymerase sigma-70 factor (ECF subfamily)
VNSCDREPSDEALCQRVAGRDEAAFDLLVERYRERAYRLAWSILRDVEDARDLSQEAFIRLYQTAGSFAGRARFSTWFYRILVNLCLDHRRKDRWWRRTIAREQSADVQGGSIIERHPAPAGNPVAELDRARTMTRLWAEVDRLSPQQRTVVLLHVLEELRSAEIAAVLGCSEATARVHLHRALRALRKTMEKDDRSQ